MDNVQWWQYPYHKYMEDAKPLKTVINCGKYTNTYGAYEYGKVPRKNLLNVKETDIVMGKNRQHSPSKRRQPVDRQLLEKSMFRSHTAHHSMATCPLCKPFTDSVRMEEMFSFEYKIGEDDYDVAVRMSIPSHKYYEEIGDVIDHLTNHLNPQPTANSQQSLDEKDRLATWIFTPSHGDRLIFTIYCHFAQIYLFV